MDFLKSRQSLAKHLKVLFYILIWVILFPAFSFAAEFQGPKIWQVSDKDTTTYIFGTIHSLKENTNWYTQDIDFLLQQADSLFLEIAPEKNQEFGLQILLLQYGLLKDGHRLYEFVDTEQYEKMLEILDELGAPSNGFEFMMPWLAALSFNNVVSERLGIIPSNGVESILTEKAKQMNIKIRGLEKLDDQIKMYASLPMSFQKTFFDEAVEEAYNLDDSFAVLSNAWVSGDDAALISELNAAFEDHPSVAEIILFERNKMWAKKIKKVMKKPGTFLVAVGAGHLLGKENLLMYLSDLGLNISIYSPRKIQIFAMD